MAIGQRLQQLRLARGFKNASAFARRLGWNDSYSVRRLESGAIEHPSEETLMLFLGGLGLTDLDREVHEFLEEEGYDDHAGSFIWRTLVETQFDGEEVSFQAVMNIISMEISRLSNDASLLADMSLSKSTKLRNYRRQLGLLNYHLKRATQHVEAIKADLS